MRTKQWIFGIALTILIAGCQKVSDLFETLSAEDEEALEEMEHALEGAMAYHDTLVWCIDTSQACVDSIIDHYEDEIHEHLHEWEEFHELYSHNNVGDDHHHGVETQHHHGDGGHVEEGEHSEEEEEHGHSIESHHEFNEFVSDHDPYHTE